MMAKSKEYLKKASFWQIITGQAIYLEHYTNKRKGCWWMYDDKE